MIKRIFDILISVVGLTLLSPVMIFLSVLVFFKLGWPIFFLQARPGLDERVFKIIKFRTMKNSCEISGCDDTDEHRLSRFGKILRATSLDELPELWNVLKGDMSIVGPRPLLVEYLALYNDEQKHRHDVKPGITGWAQVNGRNGLCWHDKFKLDVWYVDHQSFWLDIKILLMTVIKVLVRDGISEQGQATAQKFKGNE